MNLPERLQSLLDDVLPGLPMADVGTDHGLLPIAAIEQGVVPNAVAADLRPEPLSLARANISCRGLHERIDVRLGDGLSPLSPSDDLATITIAGMGGATIMGILERVDPRALGVRRLVLQVPQQAERLRRGLIAMGMGLERERLLRFQGRLYTNMLVDPALPTNTSDWSPADWMMGRGPRRRGGEVFEAWCAAQAARHEAILAGLQRARHPDPQEITRLEGALELLRAEL